MAGVLLNSPREAAALLQPGDSVYVNGAGGYPAAFMKALMETDIKRITIHQPMRAVAIEPEWDYANAGGAERFKLVSDYIADVPMREAVAAGWASYRPVHTGETGRVTQKLDWVLLRVGPPRDGLFNLGPFPACALDMIARSQRVMVEVHELLPHVPGDNYLRVEDVDYYFDSDRPTLDLIDIAAEPIDPVVQSIGRNVAQLVRDGDTIQLGIGALPEIIGRCLGQRTDLGIHSELFGDALMELCRSGVVNNSRKELGRFRSVAALALGSPDLYEFVNENHQIEFHPISWVNARSNIAANPSQSAINSAIEVDLLGQAASESIGSRTYSGSGGQWEFHRGALDSPNGQAIIALRSMTRDGLHSRISGGLRPGTAVTVPRNDADLVVTEYGVAHLRGRDMRERAAALISIAAPKFREQLLHEARELYGIRLAGAQVGLD